MRSTRSMALVMAVAMAIGALVACGGDAKEDPATCTDGDPHWEYYFDSPPGAFAEQYPDVVAAVDDLVVATIMADVDPVEGGLDDRTCENRTMAAHRSTVRVDESLKGDLKPGTVIPVLARDTFGTIYAPPTEQNDPQLILALDHDVLIPGVGVVEWAAYGVSRVSDLEHRPEWEDALTAESTK